MRGELHGDKGNNEIEGIQSPIQTFKEAVNNIGTKRIH
jgi:hypothetical protein